MDEQRCKAALHAAVQRPRHGRALALSPLSRNERRLTSQPLLLLQDVPIEAVEPRLSHFPALWLKWVSPSPKYVGAGTDDRVIWGRRNGNRLLGEAMKEQSPSL